MDENTYEGDTELDSIEIPNRLPSLTPGEYELVLAALKHVEGDTGIYDIAEVDIADSRGVDAKNGKAKISFKRDETNKMKKQINDKKLASFLMALSPGADVSRSSFISSLRSGSGTGTKFRCVVTSETAEKSGNKFIKYQFSPV